MISCNDCNKVFKFQWELRRHNKRKYPCSQNPSLPYDGPDLPPTNIQLPPNEKTPPNATQLYEAGAAYELNSKECKYCKYSFTQACNARRHEDHCKENNALRDFELKLCIPLDRYHEKDCRFCGKISSRRYDNLQHRKTCKKMKNYLNMLSDKFKEKHCKTVSNVTVNNNVTNVTNITNNVIINSTSKTDRIMRNLPEEIARWLLHDQRQKSGKHLEWQTGLKMILRTHEKPENRNLKVTSARADTVYCFNGEKDVQRPTEMVIEEEFMECLDDLLHIKKKHEQVLSRIGVMRELENYIDVVWTRDHAFRHKKAVMTGLKCQSVD